VRNSTLKFFGDDKLLLTVVAEVDLVVLLGFIVLVVVKAALVAWITLVAFLVVDALVDEEEVDFLLDDDEEEVDFLLDDDEEEVDFLFDNDEEEKPDLTLLLFVDGLTFLLV